ncbi:hypothetical protein TWF481_012195 [Arthrobotrys musiformis]|uniref:Uncharacterized protein n=1 Tax=Arthrobotrys musiformis TaxID=47236 RepID=A0AAV9VXE4_9PEZI
MTTQEERLAIVVENETKRIRDLSASAINNVTKEIKSTIFPQYRWEELLMTAPVMIDCLGSLFTASSSPVASTTMIPSFEYKVTEYGEQSLNKTSPESLRGALVECSNLGRYAFVEAEKGMGRISTISSRMVTTNFQQVVECLNSPPNAKKYLSLRVDLLKKGAEDCHEASLLIDKKLEEWLMYACKLHLSCADQKSEISGLDIKAQEIKEKAAQDNISLMKNQSEEFKKHAQGVREGYKKAMDSFPTGFELLLGDLASGYTDTMGSAFNAAASVGAGYLQAEGGAGFAGFISEGSTQRPSGQFNVPGLAQQLATHTLRGISQSAINYDQSSVATFGGSPAGSLINSTGQNVSGFADRAYVVLNTVMVYLNGIKSIVNNSDGGIDWENDTEEKYSLPFFHGLLFSIQQAFQAAGPEPTGDASIKLNGVLNTVVQVTQEVIEAAAKSERPDKSDPAVKKWQDDFNTQYNIAYQLYIEGRKLPGHPANTAPMMGGLQEARNSGFGGGEKGAGQAMVDNARCKADAANSVLKQANETLMESNKSLAEQKKAFAGIKTNVAKLRTGEVTLSNTKALLVDSIALVVKMKAQVEKLVNFFSALATTLDILVVAVVQPFMEDTGVATDSHYSLDDFTRTSIFHGLLTMRAYLSVYTDVAKMWVQLSNKHITPGLTLVEEVGMASSGSNSDMGSKINKLESWASGASAGIESLAKSAQQKLEAEMHLRVQEMAKTIQLLLPSPEEVEAFENAKADGRVPPITLGMVTDDL